MLSTLFASLISISLGQQQQCIYEVSNGNAPPYVLNLTAISQYRLEKTITEDGRTREFIYTPCRNGERCQQGSADFSCNVAEYIPGQNQCDRYLSVDNKERPEYLPVGAAFRFQYSDGELCDVTQQPRKTRVYYQCAENGPNAIMDRVEETETCDYSITIESGLACIPEDRKNANCQYTVKSSGGQDRNLNLAPLRDINPLRFVGNNGYRVYLSPCQNGINCYQQTGGRKVMSVLENTVTGTCERAIASWEDGRQQPIYSVVSGKEQYEFRYYNGEPCDNGATGSEERITFVCDESVDTAQTINVTLLAACRIDYYVATKLACDSSYDANGNLYDYLNYMD